MSELERAAAALRERAEPNRLASIEHRAEQLTRRRRVRWVAAAAAVAVLLALVSIGMLRSVSDDESIVVGPPPEPVGSSLTMAIDGVRDQSSADQVAAIVRARIAMLNLQGVGISKDDRDPRVAVDMSELEVTVTPEQLTVSGQDDVMSRISVAPALWGSGRGSFRIVRSDEGEPVDGACPSGSLLTTSVIASRCYAVDAGSVSTGLDANLTRAVGSLSGGLLVPWSGGEAQLIQRIAEGCVHPEPGGPCGAGLVSISTDDGRLVVFRLSPATPPGTPSLIPAVPMSFDESLAWGAMLQHPLPDGVSIQAPPIPDHVLVATARSTMPAGTLLYVDANVVFIPVPVQYAPSAAVTDRESVHGRTAIVDIREQTLIVEGMFE